jgi:Flp pilus assembly protein TadG
MNRVLCQLWTTIVAADNSRRPASPGRASGGRNRRGAAVVELAITSPLLCLLALGIVEYSQFTNTAKIIGDASRRGARVAARDETTSVSEVQNHVTDFVTGALPNLPSGSAVTVQVVNGSGASIAGGNLATIPGGSPVAVDVSLSFSSIRWLNFFATLNEQTLKTTTVARRE